MKVICKGYKTCEIRSRCNHSIAHDINNEEYASCATILNDMKGCDIMCECSSKYLVNEKLKAINCTFQNLQ